VQQTANGEQRERIVYPNLPLAIYREIAAHLRQVIGIQILELPQDDSQFDYTRSQIGGLSISYASDFNECDRALIESILNYYGARYGSYERLPITVISGMMLPEN
jgi:hypothetical protein